MNVSGLWQHPSETHVFLPKLPVFPLRHPIQVLEVVTFRVLTVHPQTGLEITFRGLEIKIVSFEPVRWQLGHVDVVLLTEELIQPSETVEKTISEMHLGT